MNIDFKMNFLNRMRLGQKFALLGVFALAAVALPTYQAIALAESNIATARAEAQGLPLLGQMLELIKSTQLHRDLSVQVQSGIESAAAGRSAKELEMNKQFAALEAALQTGLASDSTLQTEWAELKKDWKALAASIRGRTMDANQTFEAHSKLVDQETHLLDAIADWTTISLDPNAHTYFLGQTLIAYAPRMSEALAQSRGLGTSRLSDAAKLGAKGGDRAAALSPSDRIAIAGHAKDAQDEGGELFRFLDKAAAAEPRVKARLEAEGSAARSLLPQMAQMVQKELLDAASPTAEPTKYFQAMTDGVDAQFKFFKVIEETFQAELELVVQTQRRAEIVNLLQALALLLAAAAVGFFTVRNVRQTVASLQGSVERVRAGDAQALQNIEAKDEVGDLGRTVNLLLTERIAGQKKAEDENEGLNNSVISILQSVHQLSQRDLTARAPVTSDIIGTVSDSINALTDETTKVLHGVSRIAGQVASASGKVQTQAAMVSKTAEDERSNVSQMIDSLANATTTMNQVSTLAEQSNASAVQATQATDTALATVNATVKGMESIRETIAETEKRIKRLGERSQEISGIVNLINTISERTHVLALNASMQAAVAGEAGRGFAVVAEEVQRLAESSRNATQQIGTLVNNIQLETNETISTVNRTIGQVVQGSEQAQKAGEQMRLTQEITGRLVAQVRRIGEASDEQKTMSAKLLASMQLIGASTERTAEQITVQNTETESLLQSARRLVESVNVFKLPLAA